MSNIGKRIIIGLIFVAILLVGLYFLITPFLAQQEILHNKAEAAEYYASYSAEKDDYLLKTNVTKENDVTFLSSTVSRKSDGSILLAPKKRWRLSDFKSIRFADHGYTIVIDSGDTGKEIFAFDKTAD